MRREHAACGLEREEKRALSKSHIEAMLEKLDCLKR